MATYAAFHDEIRLPGGMLSVQMSIRPGVTLQCDPPYRKGQMDTVWVLIDGPIPKTTDRKAIATLAGMPVLPL